MKINEFSPALAAIAKGAQTLSGMGARGVSATGGAIANAAQAAGSAIAGKPSGVIAGTPATATGGAAQAQAQKAEPQQAMGAIDVVNAIKDPKVAMQLKTMKQKMPGANLDTMVDPKAADAQQKQISDLSTALDMLKKNAGIK